MSTSETPISPTSSPTSIRGQASMDELEAAQESFINKDKKVESDNQEPKKKQNRAEELFEKVQNLNGKGMEDLEKKVDGLETKSAKPKKETEEDLNEAENEEPEEDSSGFDSSVFLEPKTLEEDSEEGEDEDEEEESATTEESDESFTKDTNIKNLRKVAGSFKKERDEAQLRISQLERQIQERPDPTGLQQKIEELEGRVKQLEPFEMVFDLHNNPTFKQRYVDVPNQLVQEMQQIARDYGVGEEVVEALVYTNNRKEMDELLEGHFHSMSALSDLKSLKQRYDGVLQERQEIEKKPREALTKLHSEKEQQEAKVHAEREKHLTKKMREGWQNALKSVKELPEESRIYELIPQPGKQKHNEKIVQPTLQAAQETFEQGIGYIEQLVRAEAVPGGDFIQWFANICQQAAATQMLNTTRRNIYNRYQDLAKEQGTKKKLENPRVTSSSAPSRGEKKQSPKDGKEVAAALWEEVLG